MAAGLLTLLDDIALLMDDVTTMTKVATKKTAGILGDDLAVNAQKASGFASSRELPVLWSITKGSFLNKLIILPLTFLLSAFAPWIIIPILMVGGVYLAYEGMETIHHYFFHKEKRKEIESLEQKSKEEVLLEEKSKIKSAIITDFILSIEIIILALSTVSKEPMVVQIAVVSFIALIATIGVYGLVALIVRMDDFGYKLIAINNGESKIGEFFVLALPKVIKALTVIGTLAMLLVAGGIFLHNIPLLHELLHSIPTILADFIVGTVIGVVAITIMMPIKKLREV